MIAPLIDVCVTGDGSVYLFVLLTSEAQQWVEEHVTEDRLMLGCGMAVEHRFAAALAAGMQADGLVIDETEVR